METEARNAACGSVHVRPNVSSKPSSQVRLLVIHYGIDVNKDLRLPCLRVMACLLRDHVDIGPDVSSVEISCTSHRPPIGNSLLR
jgi:hypothetical protein